MANVAENIPGSIEPRIREFGREIFKALGQERPSALNKNYWSGRLCYRPW